MAVLRFLQALIVAIASIPMIVFSYVYFAVNSIVLWTDMSSGFKEYTDRVIELFKALINYVING